MKRTTANGNDNNRYTEGNPQQGIPATVVGASELNNMQEEICNVIEGAGLTVDQTGATEDQLLQAFNILIPNGGSNVTTFTVGNNVSSATNVTDMAADKTIYRTTIFNYVIRRKDDAEIRLEVGELSLVYDDVADDWRVSQSSSFDDSAVTFTVLASGQVQYTSDNMTGGNYEGQMEFSIKARLAI